jgi:hypothetical protein
MNTIFASCNLSADPKIRAAVYVDNCIRNQCTLVQLLDYSISTDFCCVRLLKQMLLMMSAAFFQIYLFAVVDFTACGQPLWRKIRTIGLSDDCKAKSEIGEWLHCRFRLCKMQLMFFVRYYVYCSR